MAEWTTYFSVVDTADDWTDTANAVDNNTGTYASNEAISSRTLILDTPAASSPDGAISKVEIRMFGGVDEDGVPTTNTMTPRFGGGDGDAVVMTTSFDWKDWEDITEDTNAPEWDWADVEALGVKIAYLYGSGPVVEARVYSIEVKVTYTPTGSTAIGGKQVVTNYYY